MLSESACPSMASQAHYERLNEIDVMLKVVIRTAKVMAGDPFNAPSNMGEIYSKAHARLLYLIPGEGPRIVPRGLLTPAETEAQRITIEGIQWVVTRKGDNVVAQAHIDALKSTAVATFKGTQDIVKTLTRATGEVQEKLKDLEHKDDPDAPEDCPLFSYSTGLLKQLACINDKPRSVEEQLGLIPKALWGTIRSGGITSRDIDVAVADALLVFRVNSEILGKSGFAVAERDDPMYMNVALKLVKSLEDQEAAAKKSKTEVKPRSTLKDKKKKVSSVETVKSKKAKKAKAKKVKS